VWKVTIQQVVLFGSLKMSDIKEPNHYWKQAKDYIIKQSLYLEKEDIYYIDKQLAMKYIKFGSILKLTSGDLAGVTFQFMFWQIKAIVDIFGTKYKSGKFKGLRRYQRVLFFLPKKSGKTELGALIAALIFFLDEEKGKEIYSIASEIEQAKILHKSFTTMIRQEPELEEMIKATVKPPRVTKYQGAFIDEYEALSSSVDSKDGKKPSTILCDETHTYKNKELYQIMIDGMASRLEPLEIHMSTAGYNMQGFFYRDIYLYAKKLKDGVITDDRFYNVMFEPTEKDLEDDNYWKNTEVWERVNPNMGISPTYSYMEGKISQAEQSEESLISFKTKHLNVFCDKSDIWIKHSIWTANQSKIGFTKLKELKNKKCYAGLDLASNIDITALVLIFYDEVTGYDIIPYFWIPKDNMRERVRRDKVPYLDWYKDKLIKATEGNIIDYSFLERDIKRVCEFFNVQMIGYDRWNSSDLVRRLTDDEVTDLIPIGQGISLTASNKQIETLAIQGKLNHGNNDVLNWMCSNVVIDKDSNDNYKIDKKKSTEKVDGMVALSMALTLAMKDVEEKEDENVYEGRGLRIL